MKICRKCKIEKDESEFYKNKGGRGGLRASCILCKKAYDREHEEEKKKYDREYYKKHKEEKQQRNRKYRKEHKEERKEYQRQYHKEHRKEENERHGKYNKEHKEEIRQYNLIYQPEYNRKHSEEKKVYNRKYNQEHIEEIRIQKRGYRKNNKEKINKNSREYKREYRKEHREEINNKENKRAKERRENDTCYKIRKYFSRSVNKALKKNGLSKKDQSCFDSVPYDLKQFMQNLESQFVPHMTWKNQGVYNPNTWDDNDPTTWTWNIDHIIPQSHFHFTSMDDPEFQKCWALENLRPLWSKQNILDGNRRSQEEIEDIMKKTKLIKFECEICGNKDSTILHKHHIIHRVDIGTSNDPFNLCILCPNCHSKLHRGEIKIIGIYPATKPPNNRIVIFETNGKANIEGITKPYIKLEPKQMSVPFIKEEENNG